MKIAVALVALVACDRSEPDPPAPPPEPPAPQKLKPQKPIEIINYAPEHVGVDAAPPPHYEPTAAGELDPDRGRIVVADLNELCGDSMCEGAYDYTFVSVACTHGACNLAFKAKHYQTDRVSAETITFDFFGRAFDDHGTTARFHHAIADAIRAWERRAKP